VTLPDVSYATVGRAFSSSANVVNECLRTSESDRAGSDFCRSRTGKDEDEHNRRCESRSSTFLAIRKVSSGLKD